MAEYKSGAKVTFTVNMNMTEEEARALDAIFGYGADSFLEVFYAKLGKAYLQPYEKGLRSLCKTARMELPKHFDKVDAAYKAFK